MNDALKRLLRQPGPEDEPAWLRDLPSPLCPRGHVATQRSLTTGCPVCAEPQPQECGERCDRGHLLHDLAVDHLGRCRRCVSEGRWAA